MEPRHWIALALAGVAAVSCVSCAGAVLFGIKHGGKIDVGGLVWVAFIAIGAAAYVAKG